MAKELMKNIDKAVPVELRELVPYESGKVVSRTLAQTVGAGVTLMSFDAGEGISTHAAGGDAMAYVLEGEALITIDGTPHIVPAGSAIVMPVGVPHAVRAEKRFKMMLTLVR